MQPKHQPTDLNFYYFSFNNIVQTYRTGIKKRKTQKLIKYDSRIGFGYELFNFIFKQTYILKRLIKHKPFTLAYIYFIRIIRNQVLNNHDCIFGTKTIKNRTNPSVLFPYGFGQNHEHLYLSQTYQRLYNITMYRVLFDALKSHY